MSNLGSHYIGTPFWWSFWSDWHFVSAADITSASITVMFNLMCRTSKWFDLLLTHIVKEFENSSSVLSKRLADPSGNSLFMENKFKIRLAFSMKIKFQYFEIVSTNIVVRYFKTNQNRCWSLLGILTRHKISLLFLASTQPFAFESLIDFPCLRLLRLSHMIWLRGHSENAIACARKQTKKPNDWELKRKCS